MKKEKANTDNSQFSKYDREELVRLEKRLLTSLKEFKSLQKKIRKLPDPGGSLKLNTESISYEIKRASEDILSLRKEINKRLPLPATPCPGCGKKGKRKGAYCNTCEEKREAKRQANQGDAEMDHWDNGYYR